MSKYVGIRHEDLYPNERRAPLTPKHVEYLVKKKCLDIVVESSEKRVFTDHEYTNAGARIASDLRECNIILGVKEIPIEKIRPQKTYVTFSHVVKGQQENMPRLIKMMEHGCNLIDYERIVDDQGKRLIFFGRYAGIAGMINSLWALGLRYKEQGIETPFLKIKQAHRYTSIEQAKSEISDVGLEIAEQGLPDSILPLTIGFTGYGNVSSGAQEILSLLPVKEIMPEKLALLHNRKCGARNLVYKVNFKQEHIAEHVEGRPFDKSDYYKHPHNYHGIFEKYLPSLSLLMNCMYWAPQFPRLVTKKAVERLFESGIPKLTVIGDITCDPDGSIELTHKGTDIDDPLFVYDPAKKIQKMGYNSHGMLVMAVHILPSELPRESSESFSNVLVNYIKPIVDCDFEDSYEDLVLPRPIKKALILHNGKLTADYQYLNEYLKQENQVIAKAYTK
jgi:alpha-aminoadipic semialdehyde synthase